MNYIFFLEPIAEIVWALWSGDSLNTSIFLLCILGQLVHDYVKNMVWQCLSQANRANHWQIKKHTHSLSTFIKTHKYRVAWTHMHSSTYTHIQSFWFWFMIKLSIINAYVRHIRPMRCCCAAVCCAAFHCSACTSLGRIVNKYQQQTCSLKNNSHYCYNSSCHTGMTLLSRFILFLSSLLLLLTAVGKQHTYSANLDRFGLVLLKYTVYFKADVKKHRKKYRWCTLKSATLQCILMALFF